MRTGRLTLVAALAASAVTALGGSANAAPGRVFHLQFAGSFATAIWHFRTGSTRTDAFVDALDGNEVVTGGGRAEQEQGTELLFDLQLSDLDADGALLGGVDTFGTLAPFLGSTGYSASFDPSLRQAFASGSSVPATRCTYGPDRLYISCADTTIDVSATWTGQGPIFRGADTSHFTGFGIVSNDTVAGSFRDATASATIAGTTLPVTTHASLARDAEGEVFACTGPGC